MRDLKASKIDLYHNSNEVGFAKLVLNTVTESCGLPPRLVNNSGT